MEKIGDIIKRVIDQKGREETRKVDDIDTLWYRILEPDLGEHSYIVKINSDSISVRVDNRCYLTEIKRREEEILSKLHSLGWMHIKKIRYRIG